MKKVNIDLRDKTNDILKKYLLKDGLMSKFAICYFVNHEMTEEIARCFIGLEFWKNNHSKRMDNIDMQITLMHDLKGIINNEECFLPRSNEYQKFCTI